MYVDRLEAIDFASGQKDVRALEFMKTALNDKSPGLRIYAMKKLDIKNDSVNTAVEPLLVDLAINDKKSLVRAGAIDALGKYKKEMYKDFF